MIIKYIDQMFWNGFSHLKSKSKSLSLVYKGKSVYKNAFLCLGNLKNTASPLFFLLNKETNSGCVL